MGGSSDSDFDLSWSHQSHIDVIIILNGVYEQQLLIIVAIVMSMSVDCNCGEPQTMAHLLSCRLLDEACPADDLATVTE